MPSVATALLALLADARSLTWMTPHGKALTGFHWSGDAGRITAGKFVTGLRHLLPLECGRCAAQTAQAG
jgi:hypothetical protein